MPFDSASVNQEEDTYANILRRAAALLRQYGWTQGKYCDDQGRLCILGAIGMAMTGSPTQAHESYRVARVAMCVGDIVNEGTVHPWNDTLCRTAEEAIAALEAAAAKEEAIDTRVKELTHAV